MVDRAIAICDPEFLNSELRHIATTLEKNGYPKTFVSSTIARRLNPTDSSSNIERDRLPVLTIPYYVGLGEHLQRLGRQYGFRIFFKSSPNLRSLSVKRGIVTGMVDRAIAICDPEFLNSELHHIAMTLEKNGYPKTFVSSTIARRLNPTDSSSNNERDRLPVLTVPYYVGLGEHLQRLGRQYGFRIFFKSSPNLRSLVRNDKIKVPFEQRPGVVYVINCDCNASYIGETGNTLFDRFKEHMNALKSYRSAEEELHGIY
ncbi:hypothetical protein TTRE_0000783301, partial [Trichuris trichiura]